MKNKKSILKAKLLRFLRITKEIELSDFERKLIKFCKGHYKNEYPLASSKTWPESLKPFFQEYWGWDTTEHYRDFLTGAFHRLLDLHLKIQLDGSGSNQQLKEIISASFNRDFRRDYELPVERVIAELCGQIQCNPVIVNGVHRYKL